MFNVDQFVYTTASIGSKKGYQIVAKSKGVTEKIIAELESYFYPIGVDPSEFKESRSFIMLEDNVIAYSRIKNVGLGYDGRDNTLYNHTFLFSKNDFEKYDNDSRIFDKFYLEDKLIEGKLPTLSINPPIPPMPLEINELESVLEEILISLFTNKKIALFFDNVELPQKILSFLPKSMRLISYSTLVVEPTKQPKYHFILNSKLNKSKLKKDFKIISQNKPSLFHDKTTFEKSIAYYSQLILSHKYEELKEIQNSFENIANDSLKNKLILLCYYSQFKSSTDNTKRSEYAEIILETLKQFDHKIFSFYFEKIKDSLKHYKLLKKKLKPELSPSMSLIDAFFYLPTKMMFDLYNIFIIQQKQNDED